MQGAGVKDSGIKWNHEFATVKLDENFATLEQHIEDLTQAKFSMERDLNASRSLAKSLATENSSLTDSYNQQRAAVNQLKSDMESLQEEIKVQMVRVEIQRVKLELMFKLGRKPTEEEIIEKVGISPERYREVMRASKSVLSLHARHAITQEEFINGITDDGGVGGDRRRQPALLRFALDDVLDWLKPKESLVIRQRYGLECKVIERWER